MDFSGGHGLVSLSENENDDKFQNKPEPVKPKDIESESSGPTFPETWFSGRVLCGAFGSRRFFAISTLWQCGNPLGPLTQNIKIKHSPSTL